MTPLRLFPILGPAPSLPEGRIPRLVPLISLLLSTALACAESTAPELAGTWGGPDATLILSPAGGTVEYACGSGTIDPGWSLDANGRWTATGNYFSGGGPAPSDGRPPHAASYSGGVEGSLLTFRVEIPELGTTLGPFTVRRNSPGASEMCV